MRRHLAGDASAPYGGGDRPALLSLVSGDSALHAEGTSARYQTFSELRNDLDILLRKKRRHCVAADVQTLEAWELYNKAFPQQSRPPRGSGRPVHESP